MNPKILTVLGCSSSLTAFLAPYSAQALMPSKIPGAIIPAPTITRTSSPEDFPQVSGISDSMAKQYAQVKFGCTCANCVNLARQMLQAQH